MSKRWQESNTNPIFSSPYKLSFFPLIHLVAIFLHLFQCKPVIKSTDKYKTSTVQTQSSALNNLEVTDSISVYKWKLNKFLKLSEGQSILAKDNNVLIKFWFYSDSHYIASNSTFQSIFIHWGGGKLTYLCKTTCLLFFCFLGFFCLFVC